MGPFARRHRRQECCRFVPPLTPTPVGTRGDTFAPVAHRGCRIVCAPRVFRNSPWTCKILPSVPHAGPDEVGGHIPCESTALHFRFRLDSDGRFRRPVLRRVAEDEAAVEDAPLHSRVAGKLVHLQANSVQLVWTTPTAHPLACGSFLGAPASLTPSLRERSSPSPAGKECCLRGR